MFDLLYSYIKNRDITHGTLVHTSKFRLSNLLNLYKQFQQLYKIHSFIYKFLRQNETLWHSYGYSQTPLVYIFSILSSITQLIH